MFICMIITYRKGKNQPGQVANPAHGQLAEQGKWMILCPRSRVRIWSCETGSAVPLAESNAYLRDSSQVPRHRHYAPSVRPMSARA